MRWVGLVVSNLDTLLNLSITFNVRRIPCWLIIRHPPHSSSISFNLPSHHTITLAATTSTAMSSPCTTRVTPELSQLPGLRRHQRGLRPQLSPRLALTRQQQRQLLQLPLGGERVMLSPPKESRIIWDCARVLPDIHLHEVSRLVAPTCVDCIDDVFEMQPCSMVVSESFYHRFG